ncbi:MAG: hypothetical protein BEN19_01535 [Epulopiscium sp. Nuni2H_MBin003]|nr:MAG: hypothetical protein BEN19_01535 [Epulopiscium sp. Nuni2H_MBin003]
MYQFRRNQLIIMVLVFMIAIAGYLQLTTPDDVAAFTEEATNQQVNVVEHVTDIDYFQDFLTLAPDADESDLVLSEMIGTTNLTGQEVIISKITEATEAASNNVVNVSYFAEEKMLREQQRSSQIEELNEYISNTAVDEGTKSKAAQTLLALQEKIEKENGSESLLRAKGFEEVYVRMDDTSVDVIVNKAELTNEQIAQIEEIVSRTTGYKVSQIKIHMNS